MAVRIHVSATKASVTDVRQVFGEILGASFDSIPIESTGVWNFFTTSVWGVSRTKLCEGLARLNEPGLQATTEDASRWYLTVYCPNCQPVTFLHEFHRFEHECDPGEITEEPVEEEEEFDPRLAFLQPDPDPGPKRPWSQFDDVARDYADMQVSIADEFRASVAGMNYGQAANRFRQYELERMAATLTDAGIDIELDQLKDALFWNSLTPGERDSDIGNLPRVLFALGLRGSIADCILNAEQSAAVALESDGQPHKFNSGEVDNDDVDSDDEFDEEDDDLDNDDEFDEEVDEEVDEDISSEDAADIAEVEARMKQMIAQRSDHERRAILQQARKLPAPSDSLLTKTLQAAEHVEPVAVQGGPVSMRVDELSLLNFFARAVAIDDFPPVVLHVVLPAGVNAADVPDKSSDGTQLIVRTMPDGWMLADVSLEVFDVPEPNSWCPDDLKEFLGDTIAASLRSPVNGTQFNVCYADPQHPSTWLWFCGDIENGQLQIRRTFPGLDATTLTGAIELARSQEQQAYTLRNPAEADAVMQAVRKDNYLYNMDVSRDGLTVRCQHDDMGFLARLILRARFPHAWDFAPALQSVEEKYQERLRLTHEAQRAAVLMRRQNSAPCDRSTVIYRGNTSIYWAAQMAEWGILEAQPRLDFNAAMAALGFSYLGDFVCRKLRDYMTSYFISPDRRSYALIMANRFGYAGYEFVSHFESAAHLTTSTSWMANSHPEVDMYAQCHPGMKPDELFQQHQWGIERFRTHKETTPVELEATLAGVAKLFDIVLGRAALADSMVIVETIDLSDGEDQDNDDDL